MNKTIKITILAILVVFLLIPNLVSAQGGELIWHTFQGGLSAEEAFAIDSDANGNVYIVGKGWTDWDMSGQSVIVPVNSHNSPNQFGNREFDVFVAKFTNDGALVWYTFLGDPYENDDGYDIAVDSQGNVFIVGIIRSWYQWGGNWSTENRAFVSKLNNNGAHQWTHLIGTRSSNDEAKGVAVDAGDNVYVVGSNSSSWSWDDGVNPIVLPLNPYVPAYGNNTFIAKFSNAGVYAWHTFMGPGGATGEDIVVKGINVYVAGTAGGRLNIPGVSPAIDHADGNVNDFHYYDGFAVKLNTSGTILWYTFLGVNHTGQILSGQVARANAIDADGTGMLYITGSSWRDFNNSIPINPRYTPDGGADCFVMKVNSIDNTQSCIKWSTFMGYSLNDRGEDIKVDNSGNVFVGANGLTPSNVLTMLNNSGIEQWRTVLSDYPGTGNLKGIVLDNAGSLFFAGFSGAPWSESLGGYVIHEHQTQWINDAFVAKLNVNQSPVFTVNNNPLVVEQGKTALNTGIVYDPEGNDVFVNSDQGTIVNNGDGTWTWSYETTTLPLGPYWITIWADDGNGGVVFKFFDLLVIEARNVLVEFDIHPTSWPNPINTKSKGVIPVAILGSESFDVTTIDPLTLFLEGVAPIRWAVEDVTRPVGGEGQCNDTEEGPDGFDDLTIKFDTQEIIAALGEVNDGDELTLTINGKLINGDDFEGDDCIVIKVKGKQKKETGSPNNVTLLNNYPNPFNPSTTIRYGLDNDGHVLVEIYDISGKLISKLINTEQTQGWHSVTWNGTNQYGENVPAGLYISKITSGSNVKTAKLMLLK